MVCVSSSVLQMLAVISRCSRLWGRPYTLRWLPSSPRTSHGHTFSLSFSTSCSFSILTTFDRGPSTHCRYRTFVLSDAKSQTECMFVSVCVCLSTCELICEWLVLNTEFYTLILRTIYSMYNINISSVWSAICDDVLLTSRTSWPDTWLRRTWPRTRRPPWGRQCGLEAPSLSSRPVRVWPPVTRYTLNSHFLFSLPLHRDRWCLVVSWTQDIGNGHEWWCVCVWGTEVKDY